MKTESLPVHARARTGKQIESPFFAHILRLRGRASPVSLDGTGSQAPRMMSRITLEHSSEGTMLGRGIWRAAAGVMGANCRNHEVRSKKAPAYRKTFSPRPRVRYVVVVLASHLCLVRTPVFT